MSNIECQRVKPASIVYDEATDQAMNAFMAQTAEARRVYEEAERVFTETRRVYNEASRQPGMEYNAAVARARSVFWRAVGEPEKAERCLADNALARWI